MANKKEDIEETKKVSTKNKEEENKKEIERKIHANHFLPSHGPKS